MKPNIKDHTPLNLTFSHGDLLPEEGSKSNVHILSEILRPQKVTKVVVMSENGDNLYVGNSDNSNLSDNFIAVRNKAKNSIRFYYMNNFFMHPYRGMKEKRSIAVQSDTRSAKESLAELNKFMGSKRTKNKLIAAERSAANLADLESSLVQAADTIDIGVEPEISSSPVAHRGDYLPPCNWKAKSVEEAYKVDSLLSKEILDSLDSIAKEIMEMDLFSLASDSRFSPFMMKAVAHVPKDRLKYKLLIFVDQLLIFGKSSRLLSERTHTYCSFSPAVNEKLIEEFSVPGLGGKRLRTPTMRDKILCYILILIMLCCEYVIDIGILAGTVTPLEHKRLPTLLKALGAKSGRSSPSIFKLKVPFDKPVPKGSHSGTKQK